MMKPETQYFLELFCYYLIAVNVITFIIYGIDKWKARKKKWRIPEATLLLLAVMGGSLGAWAGIDIWRHKTKHAKFKYGVPTILLVQFVLLVYLFIKLPPYM